MTGADLFPAATTADVTLERKLAELQRELDMRERVYPRLVEEGKLEPATAERRILVLRAILEDYRDERLVTHALRG